MACHRPLFAGFCLLVALGAAPLNALADYVPPRQLSPESSVIRLDKSFRDDAWLVYSYEVDAQGGVINPRIITSNGVAAVDRAVLGKLAEFRFSPASRDGQPVSAGVDPVIFTWILDLPRDMSPAFRATWETAWALFREGNLPEAARLAAELGAAPGRNAFEEVKYRVLAASIASRRGDSNLELRHLQRASEFQLLAKDNNFKNRYIEPDQYLLILERIQALQLERMMLADAGDTLALIRELGPDSAVAKRAGSLPLSPLLHSHMSYIFLFVQSPSFSSFLFLAVSYPLLSFRFYFPSYFCH